jgi:hypothetical protein
MSSYSDQEFNGAARVPSPAAETPSNLGNCTDLNCLCYNSIAGHGQMLRVVRARIGNWMGRTSLQFPVDKTPEFGYMGWKWLTQATLWTVRKDRKIKGFQLTR